MSWTVHLRRKSKPSCHCLKSLKKKNTFFTEKPHFNSFLTNYFELGELSAKWCARWNHRLLLTARELTSHLAGTHKFRFRKYRYKTLDPTQYGKITYRSTDLSQHKIQQTWFRDTIAYFLELICQVSAHLGRKTAWKIKKLHAREFQWKRVLTKQWRLSKNNHRRTHATQL